MKAVSMNKWVTKLGGAMLVSLLALPVQAQLMLAHEGHHSGGDCLVKTGDFHVSFSAYEIPEGDIPPLHAFCTSIPKAGKISMTIEIPPPARELELAVRLVKDDHSSHAAPAAAKPAVTNEHEGHEGMDHSQHSGHGAAEHGLAYLAATKHRSGIIVMAANVQEKGHYAILLEKHDDSGNVKTAVKIPLSIGMGDGHGSHGGGIGMMEIAVLILVAGGGAAYYFMRRKQQAAA